ncbi:DUF4105 domain-containing protein [Paucibacter sp. AS339]|uniref:Lnb N-terminal periplasmic domain-containing protein n=1 Tax=Paucibacter hankyongi TaxID=3133434 RepID=UPI0030B0EAE7
MTWVERLGRVFWGLAVLLCGGWSLAALWLSGSLSVDQRYACLAAMGLASVLALLGLLPQVRVFWRRLAWAVFAALFLATVLLYFQQQPSNERNWRDEVAVSPSATINGQFVTVHNIRNFDYRSELDFTPAYYDKRFDLSKFEGIDLVTSYWMGPHIAHVFLSFAFSDGNHLAISIETRTEKGEGYSTLKGFFRQYELFYAVGDERDLIRVRTNYRRDPPEDVYVYRIKVKPEAGRRVFLEYLRQMNELHRQPAFYNSLFTNCTTNLWLNARINPADLPMSWKIIASGHVPEYLYEHDLLELEPGMSLPDLQRRVHINARAQAADQAADFSLRIRAPAKEAVASGNNGKPSAAALKQ